MSLVEALYMSPARRRKLSMEPKSPKINGGLRVEVTLIGGQKLEFTIGSRLLTQELVALVASHYALRESRYFSLAYVDSSDHYHWLQEDLRLLDHDFARGVRVLPLHFSVKFFPESINEVHDAQAVELFYKYAKEQFIRGKLEVDDQVAFRLSALILHASHGDKLDKQSVEAFARKSHLIPPFVNQQNHPPGFCYLQVYEHHCHLKTSGRGDSVLQFLKEVERIPSYAVHLYEVKDRSNAPSLLGITLRGILEYENIDKKNLPVRKQFPWKQLENLYLRERKFSIEVLDSKRASLTRRTFAPANISVYVWSAVSQAVCKTIWSMAIAQHQFYLESKTSKTNELQESSDVVGELSKSCLSLSAVSTPSISRSGSHSSLHHNSNTDKSVSSESIQAVRMELVNALKQQMETMTEKLESKEEELRMLCIREGELTGVLPQDYPLKRGEVPPVVRKRVGTAFSIDETIISKIINKQDETVTSLEVEYEIQSKIAKAALKLASDSSTRKGLRRTRKHSYQLSLQKLKEIERKLKIAKGRQSNTLLTTSSTMPEMKKKPRPAPDSEGIQDDSCLSVSSSSLPSREYKETSFVELESGLPTSVTSPTHTPSQMKPRSNSTSVSPSQRLSTHSDSSYNPLTDELQTNSPSRPVSGYIPSYVCTRNQYRALHYPTLSTRGQSVPVETSPHEAQTFNRAVFNVPQQRQSIVSQSLDDLEATMGHSPMMNSTTSQHFHPHYNHPTRTKIDPPERVASLDRQRPGSGRFESRSMEHLNETPFPKQSPHESPHPPPYHQSPYTPTLPPKDSVDCRPKRRSHSVVAPAHVFLAQESRLHGPDSPVHRLVRTPSGRSYMETTFENVATGNQENIPPPPRLPIDHMRPLHDTPTHRPPAPEYTYRIPATELPPLGATQGKSAVELPPLRATNKSDSIGPVHTTPKLAYTINAQITHVPSPRPVGGHPQAPCDEPLLSLAEAARLKREQKEREAKMTVTPKNECSEQRIPAPPHAAHNISTSSIGSSGGSSGAFHTTQDSELNSTLTMDTANRMVITSGTFQPSREISKPFEMSDFYKYSTKYRGESSTLETPAPLSPAAVAQKSSPAPQQKGVYQPLAPMTCQPLSTGSSDRSSNSSGSVSTPEIAGTWECAPVHQAVPATVTSGRSAALV